MHAAACSDHSPAPRAGALESLLDRIARGDQEAFERLCSAVAGAVLGLVRRVLRDAAQSEEVTQEVLIDVWRSAARFDPRKGSAMAWITTMAHRRAVDRVRSAQASADRENRVAAHSHSRAFDEVSDEWSGAWSASRYAAAWGR